MMVLGAALVSITLVLSVLAYRRLSTLCASVATKRQLATDMADADLGADWPAFVSIILPRPARRIWTLFVIWTCVALLGGLVHLLVIGMVVTSDVSVLEKSFAYLATLIWLLALLAWPASLTAQHRAFRRTP